MITTKQISELVELLPDYKKVLIFELAKCLVADDVATPEDLAAIQKARDEYARGECVSFASAEELAAYFKVS
jgi:hypothetical protein